MNIYKCKKSVNNKDIVYIYIVIIILIKVIFGKKILLLYSLF